MNTQTMLDELTTELLVQQAVPRIVLDRPNISSYRFEINAMGDIRRGERELRAYLKGVGASNDDIRKVVGEYSGIARIAFKYTGASGITLTIGLDEHGTGGFTLFAKDATNIDTGKHDLPSLTGRKNPYASLIGENNGGRWIVPLQLGTPKKTKLDNVDSEAIQYAAAEFERGIVPTPELLTAFYRGSGIETPSERRIRKVISSVMLYQAKKNMPLKTVATEVGKEAKNGEISKALKLKQMFDKRSIDPNTLEKLWGLGYISATGHASLYELWASGGFSSSHKPSEPNDFVGKVRSMLTQDHLLLDKTFDEVIHDSAEHNARLETARKKGEKPNSQGSTKTQTQEIDLNAQLNNVGAYLEGLAPAVAGENLFRRGYNAPNN